MCCARAADRKSVARAHGAARIALCAALLLAAALLLVLLVDYVRVRVDNSELDGLRVPTPGGTSYRAQGGAISGRSVAVDGSLQHATGSPSTGAAPTP